MADLATSYLGVKLKNPIIVGSCGLTNNLDTLKQIEEAGAGAVVLKSLFEEQIQYERQKFDDEIHRDESVDQEILSLFPQVEHGGPQEHLFWVKKSKELLTIPVIGSINALRIESWVEYSKKMEDTGVDALELNFYSQSFEGERTSQEIEDRELKIVEKVLENVSIPVSVKLSSYYTSPVHYIKRLDQLGIKGVVLFNQLLQPDIDIECERHIFSITKSSGEEHRLPMRYIALLADKIEAELCGASGIKNQEHVVKSLLVGASATQIVGTLYQNGIDHISTVLNGLKEWLDRKGYRSIKEIQGKMSAEKVENSKVYKRTQYIKAMIQEDLRS